MNQLKRALSPLLFSVLAASLCVLLAACGGSDDPIDISDSDSGDKTEQPSDPQPSDDGSDVSPQAGASAVITTSGGPVDDTDANSPTDATDDPQPSVSDNPAGSSPTTTPDTSGLPDSGGPFSPGVNCNLSGNWRGIYYNDVSGVSEAIQATVTRTGLDIIIRTTKARPPGQLFTGTVNGLCGVTVIDAFDGEDWTTKFGGADANQIRIADFVIEDRDELTGRDPLNVIELVR